MAAKATGDATGEQACAVQLAFLRREQGRAAEAELIARGAATEATAGRAVLAAVLVDLGRDSEAWAELEAWSEEPPRPAAADAWLAEVALFAEVAAVVGDPAGARDLYERLRPYEDRFAVAPAGAACHGSVARPLALLAHRLDDWEAANAHFERSLVAHRGAAAPILLAHTQRQYAALLRVRGGPDDWDRAVDLLSRAEGIYRRLGIETLASQCQAVLSRSDLTDAAAVAGQPRVVNLFRRQPDGAWLLRYAGSEVGLDEHRGMSDLAELLARPGHSLHVVDLLLGAAPRSLRRGVGTAATTPVGPPWRSGAAPVGPAVGLEERARGEHEARLSELTAEVDAARRAGDAVEVALAEAERDVVEALLGRAGDPLELTRQAVTTRIRVGIDAVEGAHPELGRHLRRSVRTGTFCSYEPPSRTLWDA